MNMIEEKINQTEAKGYLLSQQYYQALIDIENQNVKTLTNEYNALKSSLQDALNTGEIEAYSEAWYDMVGDIYDVEEALQEANTALIEYQNTMRQLKWDYFDLMQDYISKITGESDFLIDVLDINKLFDEKGIVNEYGKAIEGLHAVNYNTYMSLADDYGKEMERINAELAKDPNNTTLIDRRNELLELQQEMILAAQEEMETIRDLVSEGYDLQLKYLKELIDKRKDALKAEKDLYDYQRKVADQTKSIAELEKQLQAYEGDTSEETRATIQKLKVSLEEARQDLQDTEYDKWISDQERLMDDLYNEYEELLNQRLDDLDGLVQGIIDQTNTGASEIKDTITAEAQEFGYTLTETMKTVWSVDNGIGKVVSDYNTNFSNVMTGVQSSINSIKGLLERMVSQSDAKAVSDNANVNQSANNIPSGTTTTTSSTPSTNSTTSSGTVGSPSGWGSWFVSKVFGGNKGILNVNTSIVDRLKYRDFDSSFSQRANYYKAMGGTGTYTGSASQNTWMISQMKAHGFKHGGTVGDMIRGAGEEGFILSRSGEKLIPLERVSQWDALIDSLPALNNISDKLIDMGIPSVVPEVNRNAGDNVNNTHMEVVLPNVTNYEQFKYALQHDKQFERFLGDVTIGNSLGKNSLLKYSRH